MTTDTKPCATCGATIERRKGESEVYWNRRRYCSNPCRLKKARKWASRG